LGGVLDFAEALASAHVGERGVVTLDDGGAHHIASPIRFVGDGR
jgi:hypothetical protein